MAIKVNTPLTAKSGLTVPSGALVALDTVFLKPKVVTEEDGSKTPKRVVEYGTHVFISTDAYLDNESEIATKEIKSNYKKVMTEQEYQAVLANGAIAQVWLKDLIEDTTGEGTCEVFDPFSL